MSARHGGTPLGLSVVSVEDLPTSLQYYTEFLGLTAHEPVSWAGREHEQFWGVPPGTSATAVLVGFPGSTVGQILLVEFRAQRREVVRDQLQRRFYGLYNLNFYCYDIAAATKAAEAAGYLAWSMPTTHQLKEGTGSPTEVMYEGPDAMVINLIQPNPAADTVVGRIRDALDERGVTDRGFTEVVTSSHCVEDREASMRIHSELLGQSPLIDEVLCSPESNNFLSLPPEAQTHITFMRGDSLFGKVVVSYPVNYTTVSLASRAVAPNIGYLAMGFETADPVSVVADNAHLGLVPFGEPARLPLPGLGDLTARLCREPGSGSLYLFYERS
jgi:catechol 2,3-dioxygenase-like lactoylglutathione lyase family enzyme